MAMIDYGAVVYKNGIRQNENQFIMDMEPSVGWYDPDIDGHYLAFCGDEHLTLAFSKHICHVWIDKQPAFLLWDCNEWTDSWLAPSRKACTIWDGDTKLHFQQLDIGITHLSYSRNGNHYHVIYGYGIDPSRKVWDRVKHTYRSKSLAARIDRLYRRIEDTARLYARQ